MLDTPTFSAEDRDQSAALARLAEAGALLKNEQPELLNFFASLFAAAAPEDILRSTPDAAALPVDRWEGWPNFGEADEIGRQILPGEAGADGFYYAALTRQ